MIEQTINTFTREELFKRVWEKPLLVLAKELGVSDVAIGKACRKARIPLPGRGYWLSARKGPIPLLTESPDLSDTPITFTAPSFAHLSPRSSKALAAATPQLTYPKTLRNPHPLVQAARTALLQAKEQDGALSIDRSKYLHVRVSPKLMQRALVLLDGLIRRMEAEGGKVQVSERFKCTSLLLEGYELRFRLDERTTRAPPPPPKPAPPPSLGRRRLPWTPHARPYEPPLRFVATGELRLEFIWTELPGRTRWIDRPDAPIEQRLHELVAQFPAWRAALRARRLEEDRREEEARLAAQQRRNRARNAEILRRRRMRMVQAMLQWERAQRLRAFVAAVSATSTEGTETLALREWTKWAIEQISELDPLSVRLPEVIDCDEDLPESYSGEPLYGQPPKDWWREREIAAGAESANCGVG